MHINSVSYARYYNALPSIEEADLDLKSSSHFREALKTVKEIITYFGLEAYIGLRLIHKHFSIKKDQIVVEKFQNIHGVPSLVTYPCSWEKVIKNKVFPASWIFSAEGNIKVFEASMDPAVQTGIKLIENDLRVFDEIRQVLQKLKLHRLLSIAILKRNFLIAHENQFYLEAKNSIDHKNIVQLEDRENSKWDTVISTAWSFNTIKEGIVHAGCGG